MTGWPDQNILTLLDLDTASTAQKSFEDLFSNYMKSVSLKSKMYSLWA